MNSNNVEIKHWTIISVGCKEEVTAFTLLNEVRKTYKEKVATGAMCHQVFLDRMYVLLSTITSTDDTCHSEIVEEMLIRTDIHGVIRRVDLLDKYMLSDTFTEQHSDDLIREYQASGYNNSNAPTEPKEDIADMSKIDPEEVDEFFTDRIDELDEQTKDLAELLAQNREAMDCIKQSLKLTEVAQTKLLMGMPLSSIQVAEILNVHVRTLQRYHKDGKFLHRATESNRVYYYYKDVYEGIFSGKIKISDSDKDECLDRLKQRAHETLKIWSNEK